MINREQKSASQFLTAIHHLKTSQLYFQSYILSNPNSLISNVIKPFEQKINWMLQQVITSPKMNELLPSIVEIVREKIEEESLLVQSVIDLVHLLSEDQLNSLEALIECIIKGEEFVIEQK